MLVALVVFILLMYWFCRGDRKWGRVFWKGNIILALMWSLILTYDIGLILNNTIVTEQTEVYAYQNTTMYESGIRLETYSDGPINIPLDKAKFVYSEEPTLTIKRFYNNPWISFSFGHTKYIIAGPHISPN